MIPDQVKDTQDDRASKSSASVIVTNQLRVVCNGGGGAWSPTDFSYSGQ